jgi:predicted Zn-dependent protease
MNYLDTGENYDNAAMILVDDGIASVAVVFYGLVSNVDLFQQRLITEAVHELGHMFGLSHLH